MRNSVCFSTGVVESLPSSFCSLLELVFLLTALLFFILCVLCDGSLDMVAGLGDFDQRRFFCFFVAGRIDHGNTKTIFISPLSIRFVQIDWNWLDNMLNMELDSYHSKHTMR